LVSNKKELVEYARDIYRMLQNVFIVHFDDRGNIGKRYYSQDEIGTPFCITVDYDTLQKDSVTVRNRDTTRQDRVKKENLVSFLTEKIYS